MNSYNAKRIADPVHGTIGLSDLELKIIATSAYQRLRNVKQLGLAFLVFPGADYSRFAHSIGVCHVAGRMMEALQKNGVDIDDHEVQRYRLAALLHDIGHYPFSHAMEEAVANRYSQVLFVSTGMVQPPIPDSGGALSTSYNHEALGKEILKNDPDIRQILVANDYQPEDIYSVFLREQPPRFANLVSSDLDADRIDYLLRTAHHTGLPYGSIDLDYLLSQMTLDDNHRICVTEKALRTVDHFLLSRYFDYQQVAYHKTVAAMELILKDVLSSVLEAGLMDCSAQGMIDRIVNSGWSSFDDALALAQIRVVSQNANTTDEISKVKALSLLARRPPKLIVEKEDIHLRNVANKRAFQAQVHGVRTALSTWADRFGIDKRLWYVWDKSMTFTKIGSTVPVSMIHTPATEEDDGARKAQRDRYEQEVRIKKKSQASSDTIFDLPYSLMSVLSEYELSSLRIYVLFPPEMKQQELKLCAEIAKQIRLELPFVGWKD